MKNMGIFILSIILTGVVCMVMSEKDRGNGLSAFMILVVLFWAILTFASTKATP